MATKTKKGFSDRIRHSVGCPAQRIESYEVTRPKDGERFAMARCIDCGQSIDGTLEELVELREAFRTGDSVGSEKEE